MPYSACSSFAALSGNSDLELGFIGQKPAVVQELEGSSVASRERRKKKKKMIGSKNDKSEKSEKDSVADHQQPIDHLLKVKTVLQPFFFKPIPSEIEIVTANAPNSVLVGCVCNREARFICNTIKMGFIDHYTMNRVIRAFLLVKGSSISN